MTTPPDGAVRAFLADARDAFVAELIEWLRIPSISADPARADDVQASADWLAAALVRTGFPVVEVWPAGDGGLPAVYAEWPSDDPGAVTVLVYGHHDVQPVTPLADWSSPPFEPQLRVGPAGDQLVARGAADDKGQVLLHTLGVRAHLAATGRSAPAVHLKLLVEGEEESGSPHLPGLLAAWRERLGCELIVVSDTGMWDRDTPSITTAMRGLVACQLDVRGPAVDLHSGSFGGAVPNPLQVLCRLLSGLHDDAGRVALPGFYDRVSPLTDAERAAFDRLPFTEDGWLRTAHSRAVAGEEGYSTLERIWARPTAEVNGVWGGHTGPGARTIVPAEAHAKISFRLVADQRPAEVLEQLRGWLADQVPPGIDWELYDLGGVRPCVTAPHHPAVRAVSRAVARAFEAEVLYTREGGSGPEADLADILGAPLVFLGVGLPEDRAHAPDESVDVHRLVTGAEAAAYLWADLAGSYRAASAGG
jgi:acetylornithine deacetylase/succinyl-diaminopimelate desuccinylase-like protein